MRSNLGQDFFKGTTFLYVLFCFVCLFFFRFNIKVTFYLVLQTQYNPGFTEEGCGQMSDEDNIFDPRKI